MTRLCVRRDTGVHLWIACAVAVFLHAIANASVATDTSFDASANGTVMTIAAQPDGKVLIGGTFTQVNGASQNYLARLNDDGSLDNSFAATNAPAHYVYRIEVNGSKIFVGAGDGVRQYDSNGALQWHFPMQVKTFAVDSQQRVIIGGQFTRVEGQFHRNLARLTSGGALDSTFTPEIGCCAGEGVFALASRGDSMLVGGAFQSVNGAFASHLALLGNTGAPDAGFNASADPSVVALASTANGGFLRVSERTVARHLANGATDPQFAPLTLSTPDERFLSAVVQENGKTIVGGNVSSRGNVTRLNGDGTLDASFAVETDGAVYAIARDSDGAVLLGGSFASVSGSPHAGLVKLRDTSGSAPSPALSVARTNGGITLSWQANAGSFALEAKDVNGTAWAPLDVAVSSANGVNAVTLSAGGAGNLFRLRAIP